MANIALNCNRIQSQCSTEPPKNVSAEVKVTSLKCEALVPGIRVRGFWTRKRGICVSGSNRVRGCRGSGCFARFGSSAMKADTRR